MWLDELNDLVVELNSKIEQHREVLQKSESATRYCLIDPLLTALGWDLSDPANVLTEYNSGNGRADYAMVPASGPPSLVVEAKSLNTPTERGIGQSINYCLQDGIKYFVVTNGDDWEVYETHRPVPMDQKRVTAFKITDMNQSTVMGMLWLWRGNFTVGEPAMPQSPPTDEDSLPPSSGSDDTKPEPVTPRIAGTALSELTDVTGQTPPKLLSFPDGISKPVGKWNRVQIATAEWLIETGKLTESDCPLTNSHRTHLVHTSAFRRDGKPFTAPLRVGQFWIDGHASARNHVSRAKDVLNAVQVDPATVFVS